MPLNFFEVLEQIMIATFLIKLTQFEKSGQFSIPLANLNIKINFRN